MSDFYEPADDTPDPTPASPGLISSASAPPPSQVSAAWSESTASVDDAAGAATNEPAPGTSVVLSAIEARVLGVLIEKSYLTPDVYPMTTNAMVTGSNQKTNRDPVVDYSAVDIDAALMELRGRNLVRRVHSQGSRSTKHRQTLDEVLSLSERQLVLLSVMLLRGAQTVGELRIRTERHDVGFDDLDAVESCLASLASRTVPLVKELARQPGQKENRWQHLLGDPDLVDAASPSPQASPTPPAAAAPSAATEDLQARVEALESEVAVLRRQLRDLAGKLGEQLE